MAYEWLTFSLILLGAWFVIFTVKPSVRKKMFWTSLFTMPFGLTEFLFVPEYWSPPSLFDLAARTGFDIESLIFTFAVGGIAAVLHETVWQTGHKKMTEKEMHSKRHNFHLLALTSPVILFILLQMSAGLNPIYSASIAMFVGGTASILCRPDLNKKVWAGGGLLVVFYFIFFLFFNLAYPYIVQKLWNLSAISGILF